MYTCKIDAQETEIKYKNCEVLHTVSYEFIKETNLFFSCF